MPKGYPRKTREPGTVVVAAPAPKRKGGRPAGRKNNTTLMKEAVLRDICLRAQGYLIHEVEGILKAVVKKALEGDMQAAKLILDRAIPVQKAAVELPKGNQTIQINIVGGIPDGKHPKNGATVDGWHSTADREEPERAQGGEEFAEHGGEEGERPDA